jgi:hypothetical protein
MLLNLPLFQTNLGMSYTHFMPLKYTPCLHGIRRLMINGVLCRARDAGSLMLMRFHVLSHTHGGLRALPWFFSLFDCRWFENV